MPPSDLPGASVWRECKIRAATLARHVPNALVVDFMRPSPITDADDNYWDGTHYRVTVADRIARDLATANCGEASPDYRRSGEMFPRNSRTPLRQHLARVHVPVRIERRLDPLHHREFRPSALVGIM